MRSSKEVESVRRMIAEGLNDCEISRRTQIPRATIRDWRHGKAPDFQARLSLCAVCQGQPAELPQSPYTYLLGLYLGDGCLSFVHRGVYKLRIACANAYPDLRRRCEVAIATVLPSNKVGQVPRVGCVEIYSVSKHWPCLFPQHGPGVKHKRKIELTDWQQELIDRDPRPLIAGLIHSDGCRVLNWVNGTPYPRYHFTNHSDDIKGIFGRACDALGIEWRPNNRWTLSVAKRGSVALLDEFVGPKR